MAAIADLFAVIEDYRRIHGHAPVAATENYGAYPQPAGRPHGAIWVRGLCLNASHSGVLRVRLPSTNADALHANAD